MRLPIKPMIVMIVDVDHDDLLVGKVSVLHSWLTSLVPRNAAHYKSDVLFYLFMGSTA